MITLGVISDTHGSLPDRALAALAGVDRILHAGDLDSDDILVMLEAVAPLIAVRGNMDTTGAVASLPDRAVLTVGSLDIVIQHRPFGARPDAQAAAADVLVHGHTHEPSALRTAGQLTLNPGAIWQPRRGHGPTLALLSVGDEEPSVEFVELLP